MRSYDEIVIKIMQLIEAVTNGKVKAALINQNDELINDLGLDSIDFAAVMLGCEEWLGIKLHESSINWAEIRSIRRLAELFIHQSGIST